MTIDSKSFNMLNYIVKKTLPILLFVFCISIVNADIYDSSWALVIGIDKYENVRPLNYAVKDAKSIQGILVETFAFPSKNITLLTDKEATRENILKSFFDITKNVQSNDRHFK